MKPLRQLKYFLYFNKKEALGFLAFSLIIILILIISSLFSNSNKLASIKEEQEFLKKVRIIEDKLSLKRIDSLFFFNPNSITKSQLVKLGFSEKHITSFLKFRNAGGKFYKKEDFKKFYFINDNLYKKYAPYIQTERRIIAKETKKKKSLFKFNPNTLSSKKWEQLALPSRIIKNIQKYIRKGGKFRYKQDFQKVYGLNSNLYKKITPYLLLPERKTYELNTINKNSLKEIEISAKTISIFLNFRTSLGGFYSKNQISQVYGISNREKIILNSLNIDKNKITKININTADVKQLIKHPYINRKLATQIIKYRKKTSGYSNLSVLQQIQSIDQKTFNKITPYLSVND